MQKSLNSLIITGLLFLAPAYTNTYVHAQLPKTSTQDSSEKFFTKDELYFGLSKPGGNIISELEWQLFLNSVVTPRFREGLSVIDVHGQYLNNSGITREKTKLVILIYENSQTKNQMIQEVIATYKRKFQQESVLRVTSTVKVSF